MRKVKNTTGRKCWATQQMSWREHSIVLVLLSLRKNERCDRFLHSSLPFQPHLRLFLQLLPNNSPFKMPLLLLIERHITTPRTWLVVIIPIQHPMLNDAFLRIQRRPSHLISVRLWLHRVCAPEMHVVGRWAACTWAAGPVVRVIDAHSAVLRCVLECASLFSVARGSRLWRFSKVVVSVRLSATWWSALMPRLCLSASWR